MARPICKYSFQGGGVGGGGSHITMTGVLIGNFEKHRKKSQNLG